MRAGAQVGGARNWKKECKMVDARKFLSSRVVFCFVCGFWKFKFINVFRVGASRQFVIHFMCNADIFNSDLSQNVLIFEFANDLVFVFHLEITIVCFG